MLVAISAAVFAHLSWCMGNLLNVVASRRIGALRLLLGQIITQVIVLFPAVFFFSLSVGNGLYVAVTILLAVLLHGGTLLFFVALQSGSAPIVGSVTSIVPVLIVLLSVLFLGARLTESQVVLIAVMTAGLVLIALPARKVAVDRNVLLALLAIGLWAIYFTFIARSVEYLGWFWANYLSVLSGLFLVGLVAYKVERASMVAVMLHGRTGLLVVLSGICTALAPLAYNFALTLASPAIVSPIAGSYAALFVILSRYIYGDRVTNRQAAGIVLTVASVVVFSIISS